MDSMDDSDIVREPEVLSLPQACHSEARSLLISLCFRDLCSQRSYTGFFACAGVFSRGRRHDARHHAKCSRCRRNRLLAGVPLDHARG